MLQVIAIGLKDQGLCARARKTSELESSELPDAMLIAKIAAGTRKAWSGQR